MNFKGLRAASSVSLTALISLAAAIPATAQSPTETLQESVRDLARRASAAVVSIHGAGQQEPGTNPYDGQARGSGFFIAPEGHIITHQRFVRGRRRVEVRLQGGLRAQARVVGVDPLDETALLVIDDLPGLKARLGGPIPALELGRSVDLRAGQSVFTCGNMFDSLDADGQPSFSWGRVVSIGRLRGATYRGVAIEIDAAVNPGSFGGPLLDRAGKVVGVVIPTFDAGRWLGMAVPSDPVRMGAEDLIAGRSLTQGQMGIVLKSTGGEASLAGLEVVRVEAGSPAESAGVKTGDRVLSLDGERTLETDDVARALESLAPGSPIMLGLRRADRPTSVRLTLGRGAALVIAATPTPTRPQQPTTPRPQPTPTPPTTPAPPAQRSSLGIRGENRPQGGVIVSSLIEGGAAERAGLVAGDVVLSVGGEKTETLVDLRRVLDKHQPGAKVSVQLERRGWLETKEVDLGGPVAAAPTTPTPPVTPTPPTTPTGKPGTGWLGIYLKAAPLVPGAEVETTQSGSPAATAGLRAGDLIIEANGQVVAKAEDLINVLRGLRGGDALRLRLKRGQETLSITLNLGILPGPRNPEPPPPPTNPTPAGGRGWLGAAIRADGAGFVVDQVDPRSPAATAGLRAGDRIVEVGAQVVKTMDHIDAALATKRPGEPVRLLVDRDGWTREFSITLGQRPAR